MRIVSKPKKLKRSQRPPFFKFWAELDTIVEKDGVFYILRSTYAGDGYSVETWDKISKRAAELIITRRNLEE